LQYRWRALRGYCCDVEGLNVDYAVDCTSWAEEDAGMAKYDDAYDGLL
jgi:hypothetical protein